MLVTIVSIAAAGPIEIGELGGASGSGNADWCYKLDVLELNNTVRLVSFGQWLEFAPGSLGGNELTYVVYEEVAPLQWQRVWDSGLVALPPGGDFHPTPPIDIELVLGRRYALGAYFSEGNYDYRFDDPATLVDLGWARLQGSVWTAEDATYALPTEIVGVSPSDHAYHMQVTVEVIDQDGDGSTEDDDCDDADILNFPGNLEYCDGLDNDCTGVPDDPVDYVPWYPDADGDGFGDAAGLVDECDGVPPDSTYVLVGTDCNDADAGIFPGQPEYCDGVDDDCDGNIDNDLVVTDGWTDSDGDGFGDPASPAPWCERELPLGVVRNAIDCDDANPAAYPMAPEDCDGVDNDCDNDIDEDLPLDLFWADLDEDGFGDPNTPLQACAAPPQSADNPRDCDDANANRFPGNTEVCDGVDNDCDSLAGGEGDFDGDGFFDCEDCRSDDPSSYPGAPEVCDGLDHDCDGVVPAGDECTEKAGGCGCANPGAPAGGLLQPALVALAVAFLAGRRRNRLARASFSR